MSDILITRLLLLGFGIPILVFDILAIRQLVVTICNRTQQNINKLAKFRVLKWSAARAAAQRCNFTAKEAFYLSGMFIVFFTGALIGCIGAYISVFY